MKGLELSERYFDEFGRAMLESDFSDIIDRIAVGLCGSGSECFGFDDDVSTDHDFEPGFCIFLPSEDVIDRKTAFMLERAYSKLPKEYLGYRRGTVSPVGGMRHGVMRTSDFFTQKTGSPDGVLSLKSWLTLPMYSLAEAVNGKIFFDGYGEISAIRERLSASSMPEDVRLKRLAGDLLIMAQSGQYNYRRCLAHGETAAAQLAVNEFVKASMDAVFLLNREYMPFYKWSFRAMRSLPLLSMDAEILDYLLTTSNAEEYTDSKSDMTEQVASDVIEELMNQKITSAVCGDLEKHAQSVNDMISDGQIRNLNILYCIN